MEIDFTKQFEKDFDKLPEYAKKQTAKVIVDLTNASSLFEIVDCIKLKLSDSHYRIRRNDYRIILELEINRIILQSVNSRGQSYKKK